MNILFSRDLCATLVLTFGHFLWIGTLIAIVTSMVVRRQQTSRGRYVAWLTGLLVTAGSPMLTFAILQVVAAAPPVTEMVNPAPAIDSPSQLPEVAPTDSEMDHHSDVPSLMNDHSEELPFKSVPTSPDIPVEVPKAPASMDAVSESAWWRDYAPLVMSFYLIGVAMMGLRLLLGLWGGHKLRYQSELITQRWMLDALQRQADALGLILVPAMAYCERVTVPTVLGILQPMILLPMTLASGLTPGQIESVLAHELAHLRRFDHLVNLLQCVIESLLFFHPAVWWLSRRVRDEREHCCDDLVIASGAVPLDYAASLLRVAELSREAEQRARNQHRTFTAASLFATGDRPSTLRQRIARLLGYQTELHVRAVHSWVLFCLATCCVGAIWVLTSTTWIVLAEISRDRSQKTIIINWSAIVDDSVMNEIRAINGLVTKETGLMETPVDAKFSTLHCSAEELRAILKNHADNKRLVALQKTIRHAMPTGGWRIGAEKRFFQMIDSEVVQTEEKTAPSYHVNWHADGNETRDEDSDRARLIVEGNYNFRQEGMVPVVKSKVDMPSDGDADKATKHQTGTILSKAKVKFDSVMSDGESTLVILSPPAVVRQYSELVKDTKGQHYETKAKQAPKLHAIFVHEAVRVPVKQLDQFHKLTRVEDWVRRGSNATKEHAARITEWQSRPSRSVFDADAAFTRRLGTGGYVQLVGLGRPKEAPRIWWTPTGKPLLNVSDLADQSLSNYELAAIVRVWETGASRVQDPPFGMRGYGNVIEIPDRFSAPGSQLLIVHAMLDRATGKSSLKFGAGFGAWTAETTIGKATGSTATLNGVAITTQTAFEHQGFDPASRSSQPKLITVTRIPFNLKPTPDFEFTGHAVTANESITEFEWGPRAYANESKVSLSINHPGPQAEIQHFLIKSRPIHWTEFNDFATEPAVPLVPPLEFGKEQETDVRPFSAKLPGGVTVNLVGVGMPPSQPRAWWQANGTPLAKRPNASLNGYHSNGFPNQADCREIALELVGLPQDHFVTAQVGSNVSGVAFSNFQNGVKAYNIASGPFSELETTSVQVSLSLEPLGPVQRIDIEGRKLAEVDVAPELKSLYNRIQPIRVESHNDRQELLLKPMGDLLLVADWRLYAIDTNGKEVPPATSKANGEGSVWSFKLARENLARFEYRMRPYRHWVKFENVSLHPGKQTEVKVTVSAAPKSQQFVANLPNGLSVEFVGLAEMGKEDKNWWRPNGEPLDQVPAHKAAGNVSVTGQEMRRTLIRVHGAKSHLDVTTNMTGERAVEATDSGEPFVSFVGGLGFTPPQKTARVEVGVATVPLSPLRRIDSTGKRLPNEANDPVDHIAEDITILSVTHPRLRALGDHKINGSPVPLKPDEIAENDERRKQTEITFFPLSH